MPCTLMTRVAGLTNADQRITEDVEKFAFSIADLYSYTFKPLLDVLLFTRSLARIMGYRGQACSAHNLHPRLKDPNRRSPRSLAPSPASDASKA